MDKLVPTVHTVYTFHTISVQCEVCFLGAFVHVFIVAPSQVSCIVGRLKEDLLQVQQVHHLKGFAGSSVSLEGPSSKSFVLTAQLKLFVDLPTKVCVHAVLEIRNKWWAV